MGFIFNVIRRLIIYALKLIFYVLVFGAVIVLIPNLPPYTKFSSVQLEPTQPKIGPLAPNELLNNAEHKYKGKLLGPEAFQEYNGELYTSVATGEIVKVSPAGHVTFVTKIGQPCSGLTQEHICGRPLGFQIDEKSNSIYVADAYHGIWKVNLKTDKKQLLVSSRVEIDQRQPKLFNSIALAENGDFYWTDSSSDYNLKDGFLSVLADPSGRLFHYNAAKNESKVLLDGLWFANGLVLSPNKEFLVVAESFRFRLMKYYITGPKKGKSEVFIAGIPGVPDNLRPLPDGSGFLVGLYMVFDEDNPLLMQSLSETPIVRKFISRLSRLIEIPFEYLNDMYPHYIFEEIVYTIGHFASGAALVPDGSGLLQVDWNGNIVATYYNTDKTLFGVCDAIVFNDKLYIGHPHTQDFIAVVPVPPLLRNAFAPAKKAEIHTKETKKVENKPIQQAPKKIIEEKPKFEKSVEQKVAAKPKVEKPVQPKIEEKPKLETKPKDEDRQKEKVQEKPKIEPKPKIEQKQDAPKVAKPAVAQPKPNVQTKPVEQAKPTQKPVDKTHTETKPTAPTTNPPPKSTTSKPTQKTQAQTETPTTPKPQAKTTPPPKSTEKVTSPPPKTTPMPATQPKTSDSNAQKPVTENPKPSADKTIPIKEEIKADTIRPQGGETLKVIKRGGPAEIPVPSK